MNIYVKYVILGVASFFVLCDVLLLLSFCKKPVLEKTGLKVFFGEDFFFLGDSLARMTKRGTNGKRIRKLEEIYGREFAGKVGKSAAAASYTYVFLFVPVILFVFVMTGNKAAAVLMSGLLVFMVNYFDFWLDGTLRTRHGKILREFATVMSKMSLLVNAGIAASDAFSRVAFSNDGILYLEMQRAADEMENGRRTDDALDEFCFRCGCKEVRKFVSLYKQNLVKGGPEFPLLLSALADSAWDERKSRARLLGAAAEQKLLLPIMLMFIGVLLIVIVPAFNSLL